jgi:hypothetical protein
MTQDNVGVEDRVSGFRVRGSWGDVVAHGIGFIDAFAALGVVA